MKRREGSTIEGWRANALQLHLGNADLDLLDAALCIVPELRIVVLLGQLARSRRLAYPVVSTKTLADCLGDDTFDLAGHRVNAQAILHTMPEAWFPIAHEGELLSAIHLALVKCRTEARQEWVNKIKQIKQKDRF